jgi:hypothetical protein
MQYYERDQENQVLQTTIFEQTEVLEAERARRSELEQALQNLRISSELDKKKIVELVRKMEEIMTLTPTSNLFMDSRRVSEMTNDKKLLRQKQQDYRHLEQQYLQECEVRSRLENELNEMKLTKAVLEKELEAALLQNTSLPFTPSREVSSRPRKNTAGSLFRFLLSDKRKRS